MLKKPASVVLASLRGLNVRPGKTPALAGEGWAGANSIRFASSLAAALPAERRVLARGLGG